MRNLSTLLTTFITLILLAAGCAAEEPTTEKPAGPGVLIPYAIAENGDPVFPDDKLFVNDYSNLLHAVFMIAGNSRPSEYAAENYKPDLYPDMMNHRAEVWLDLVREIDLFFHEHGKFYSYHSMKDDFEPSGVADLSIYPHLVYSYHMHHRGDRFNDQILFERLSREVSNYMVMPGRYLFREVFTDGAFRNNDGSADHKSMSYGLGGVHGHAYAWIIWAKPAGEDNMGLMMESALEAWLDYSIEEMTGMYRSIAEFMDHAWDERLSIYDFGDGTTWNLDAVGAMIRGKKAMYDMLYMFGDEDDRNLSRTIFERTTAMFEAVVDLAKPWGLPSAIEFTENGAVAASDEVDLYDWYQFLNHIGGGYSFDREREATAMFITNSREDLFDVVGELSDNALLGALEYHINSQNRLVSTVSYQDGSVIDETLRVSTAGMFITTAGNIYRKGSAFERASDWGNVSDEVSERSRKLYDVKFHHIDLLESFLE
ncbi:MAG: hypothetical protein EA391_00565 [Balneolaceae bacterium]|nr:MAG: hypothetical protein EA391_00565 [Balneolaceae bacterium]